MSKCMKHLFAAIKKHNKLLVQVCLDAKQKYEQKWEQTDLKKIYLLCIYFNSFIPFCFHIFCNTIKPVFIIGVKWSNNENLI